MKQLNYHNPIKDKADEMQKCPTQESTCKQTLIDRSHSNAR